MKTVHILLAGLSAFLIAPIGIVVGYVYTWLWIGFEFGSHLVSNQYEVVDSFLEEQKKETQ